MGDDGSVQTPLFASAAEVGERLAAVGYLADAATATTVFLADRLGKPLLVEGPAGTGKTEPAQGLGAGTGPGANRRPGSEGRGQAPGPGEWG